LRPGTLAQYLRIATSNDEVFDMTDKSAMFPVPGNAASSGTTHVQWLAGLAMQSLITCLDNVPDTEAEREEIALWAYRMAQAMKKMETRIHLNEMESGQ
jgi:hypothetical protein